jgi:hypothetical protein
MLISFLPTILLLSAVEVLLGYWAKVAQEDMTGFYDKWFSCKYYLVPLDIEQD